ncbi:MAG: hypothetical protein OXC30_04180 [Alphaproteobacteria bacterium]|nr:hypothetical protein [Alphaproteobacteria bacterium]
MFKLLLLLLLSLNLPAAWFEYPTLRDILRDAPAHGYDGLITYDEAEVLWDPTEGRVFQISVLDILNAFEEDLHPRGELFAAVEQAMKQGKDLSTLCFFGEEEMSQEQKDKIIAEATAQESNCYLTILLLDKDFVGVKHCIEKKHLLSAFKQYNDENDQKLLSCIQDMKKKMKEYTNSPAIDQQEHYLTFKQNQEGHLCVIDLFAERQGGEWIPVREIYAVKVIKPSFAPYISKIPGYCFKILTEQEEIHSDIRQSVLGVSPPEAGSVDGEVRLTLASKSMK